MPTRQPINNNILIATLLLWGESERF